MLDRAQLLGRRAGVLHRATLEAMATSPRATDAMDEAAARAADWLSFARRNRVGPLVAHALIDRDAGGESARRIHDHSAARLGALMGELDRIAAALAADGVAMIALKNAGIARAIAACAACCPMGDIDVLIDRDRFVDAHHRIVELGFDHASRSVVEPADLEHALISGGAEYRRQVGEHEVWLELQWRAIAGRWIRADQEPPTAELISRSVAIDGTDARLLAPVDNMIQVALHTAKHSYARAPGLRLHTDVDRLAARTPPDWTEFLRRCRELEIETASYFSLALAEALLDSAIPSALLDELAPRRWKIAAVSRWLEWVDLFEPDEAKFSRPGLLAFQALLYDDARGLAAAAMNTDPGELGWRQLPRNLRRGWSRLIDLATRYQ
jgi:hypothetical protein